MQHQNQNHPSVEPVRSWDGERTHARFLATELPKLMNEHKTWPPQQDPDTTTRENKRENCSLEQQSACCPGQHTNCLQEQQAYS